MEVKTLAKTSEYVHIGLTGRMDSAGVGAQETRIYALFAPTNSHAILDLTGVTFLASMGIRVLITAAKTARSRGRKSVVVASPGHILDTIEQAGLSGILTIAPDVDAAIESLRSDGKAPA